MNWLLLFYNFLLIIVVLDAVASTMAAWYIFKLRRRLGWYIAMAFSGVAAEAMTAAVTMGFGSAPQRYIAWAIGLRILVRIFKTVTMVRLPLFLLGYINGDHPEVMEGKPQ